jgi:hypothetical protein
MHRFMMGFVPICASLQSAGNEQLRTKELELAAEGLKSKKPRTLSRSGRGFLRERVYTDLYFFVKGNLQLFLFFLELVSFQEHSSSIPQSIFPCAATGLARIPAS